MLDYAERLERLSVERNRLAKLYGKNRKEYGEAKSDIDIIYAANIEKISEIKKNCGYETGLLLLIALKPEIRETYKTMIKSYNNYKAIQRLIDAIDSKTMTIQSIMRYNRTNDGGM